MFATVLSAAPSSFGFSRSSGRLHISYQASATDDDFLEDRFHQALNSEVPRTCALLLGVFTSWRTVSAFQASKITSVIRFGHATPFMNPPSFRHLSPIARRYANENSISSLFDSSRRLDPCASITFSIISPTRGMDGHPILSTEILTFNQGRMALDRSGRRKNIVLCT